MTKPDVLISVSVLSYNTKEILYDCLKSVQESINSFESEILVVDNNSSDRSAEMVAENFPTINLTKNSENRYYTKGHNQNIIKANGKYILILNSDIILNVTAVKEMIKYLLTNKNVGAVIPKSVLPNGQIERTIKRKYSTFDLIFTFTVLGKILPIFRKISKKRFEYDMRNILIPVEVETAQDSCLLITNDVVEKIGIYDERFKLFFGDSDLCNRIKKSGYKLFYLPQIEIVHYHSQSTKNERKMILNDIYQQDFLAYSRKYHNNYMFLLRLVSIIHCKFFKVFYFLQTRINLKK